MTRILLFLLLLLTFSISQADETDDALDSTIVPVADPVDLAQRLRGVTDVAPPPANPPIYQLGDEESLWVSNSSTMESFAVPATLRVIGKHVYLWVDNSANLEQSDLEALADAFDEQVYNQTRELWGTEDSPGVDGDARLHVLFAYGLGMNVGAYFSQRHTYPGEVIDQTNEREMFFVNLDAFFFINGETMESTLAHEFQHMIRYNLDANEDTWMNEGFSTFTELYLGYSSPNRYPDMFLPYPNTQLNTFALSNESRGANYGAGFMLVTYFYERYGLAALNALSETPENGLTAVDHILEKMGEPGVDEFFADWVLVNYIQDASQGYGYTMLDTNRLPPTQPGASTQQFTGNQYATTYFEWHNPTGSTLDVSLSIPNTTQLIPTHAASGTQMWYSNRADTSDMTLTHAFDLTNVDSATLNFNIWYSIEEFWDYGYLVVSTDGGATWEFLSTPHTTTEDPFGNIYGEGYTGYSNDWVAESVSLDQYAGQEILVRFEYITDDAVTEPGFAIDDVAIPEIGYFSDFETDDGGWESAGWILMDNVLPQRAWVQVIQYDATDSVQVMRWLAAGDDSWSLDLEPSTERVIIAVSPFAPVTTVPVDYTLSVGYNN